MIDPRRRVADAIKARLDVRYARSTDLANLQTAVAALERGSAALEQRIADDTATQIRERLGEHTVDISRALEAHQAATTEALADLASAIEELRGAVAAASRFLGSDPPGELRLRLLEAHRIARESSLAIELILQEELRMKRDIGTIVSGATPRG